MQPRLNAAELCAATATSAIAVAMLAADVILRAGLRVAPSAILALALAGGIAIAAWLRRVTDWNRTDALLFAAVVGGVAAPLLWIAWPDLLPLGGGPDLTHHLVLINFIQRQWRLVVDPALVPYLGDMMYYTPGSHLLIALAGAWTRVDALQAAHPVLVVTVTLKAAFVLCVALRLLPPPPDRSHSSFGEAGPRWFALVAVLLLFLPYQYFVGSFAHDSFWAQVVAELFACGAWWALVVWDESPSSSARTRAIVLFALFGSAAFVAWPIWIGPLVLSAAAIVALRGGLTRREKAAQLATGIAPIAATAALHTIGRLRWLKLAATSGAVVGPSVDVFGWPFALLSLAGIAVAAWRRPGRAVAVFLGAIVAQALVLLAVARASGTETPYMARKMMFLTPYPLAVAGAMALAGAAKRARLERYAWTAAAIVAAVVAYRIAKAPRPAPVVMRSTFEAGRWVRTHAPPACVDYLVADGYSAYWLHLAVLDNPRTTARVADASTFDPQKAFARWIAPAGLPYAIVDDVNRYSKALFSGTDTIARFGPSAVIKRRGLAMCAE